MKNRIDEIYHALLLELGENPEREGLIRTPHRAAEAMRYMTRGYHQNLEEIVNGAIFHTESDDMVIVRDIEFFSNCEHHIIPFFGLASIAYIPDGKIIGLSKLARITDMYARRLQVQERLTVEIAEAVDTVLKPKGVAVVLQAQHLCMMARGVEKKSSDMVTSHVLGVFRSDRATRAEFMDLLKRR
jgi:GTP cyclohydrolase I